MKMQQRVLMVSIRWADTEEAQNSYAFFRSPASVSCEALIQFKLLSSNCAKTMQDFKYFDKSNFWHAKLFEKQLSIDKKNWRFSHIALSSVKYAVTEFQPV